MRPPALNEPEATAARPRPGDDELRLLDFAEDGRITRRSILSATAEADGRAVVFPAGQTIVVSPEACVFNVPVNWRAGGPQGCTVRAHPSSRHDARSHSERWWEFRHSVEIDGVHFDGSSRVNKVLVIAPRERDTVRLVNGSAFNAYQPATEDGENPIGGFAACISVHGKCERLTMDRFHLHHSDAGARAGGNRPNSRGINFTTTPRGLRGTEGSPRYAEIRRCDIHHITAGRSWGSTVIEADGIVWRNLRDGRSFLDVVDCRFWSCAKRPFKANIGDNWRLITCLFREIHPGHRSVTISAQHGHGKIISPTWDFPDVAHWPTQGLVSVSDDGELDLTNLVEIVGGAVHVRSGEPVPGNRPVLYVAGNSAMATLRDTRIAVPGGLEQVVIARMNGHGSPASARAAGARIVVEGATADRVSGSFTSVDRSGSGHTYQQITLQGISIGEGNQDPGAVERRASNLIVEVRTPGRGDGPRLR